jgi:hypothetical protein
MKLGLQNYVVVMPIEGNCIRFNNNKIDSLKAMTLFKITEFYLK